MYLYFSIIYSYPDEYCDRLIEHGAVSSIISAMETFPGDQRIAHVGLSALRNLSIPGVFILPLLFLSLLINNYLLAKHKTQIVETGGLQLAIQHLSTMNQVIQFEAVGILKCLLLDKTVLNDYILCDSLLSIIIFFYLS